jgi:hypothetical protein
MTILSLANVVSELVISVGDFSTNYQAQGGAHHFFGHRIPLNYTGLSTVPYHLSKF